MNYHIQVKGLTKKFKNLTAVDQIHFRVAEGEIFGFLGPNGAGKTTTVKMLTTTLSITEGEAYVLGHDVSKHPNMVRKAIGVVFQDPSLDDQLTGRENLEFHGRMYGMEKKWRQDRIKKMLKLVELSDKKDILIKNYSGGMRRRLEIARGFMHQPKILFLDEPTIGLDVQTRRAIWEYIRKVNQEEKTTIILTTHYMEEADSLCHRVSIIDHGMIIITASPKELKDKVGMDIISLRCQDSDKMIELLKSIEWINDIKKRDGACTLSVEGGEEKIPMLVTVCAQNGLPIRTITIRKPTLDDVFLHYTGKTIREEKGSFMDKMRFVHQRHPHLGGR